MSFSSCSSGGSQEIIGTRGKAALVPPLPYLNAFFKCLEVWKLIMWCFMEVSTLYFFKFVSKLLTLESRILHFVESTGSMPYCWKPSRVRCTMCGWKQTNNGPTQVVFHTGGYLENCIFRWISLLLQWFSRIATNPRCGRLLSSTQISMSFQYHYCGRRIEIS